MVYIEASETSEQTPEKADAVHNIASTDIKILELDNQAVQKDTDFNTVKRNRLQLAIRKKQTADKGESALDILKHSKVHMQSAKNVRDIYDDVKIYPNPLLHKDLHWQVEASKDTAEDKKTKWKNNPMNKSQIFFEAAEKKEAGTDN